jgi:polyisoprenyl-phosphate glycosyltransferase
MSKQSEQILSFVVPVYNESAGLLDFHKSLIEVIKGSSYELIYVDDGSTDSTAKVMNKLAKADRHIRLVRLSRNFGKEIATTAGIHQARGRAIITLDADGQHPVKLIPQFIARWQAGAKVVIGVRSTNQKEGFVKRYGSRLFYRFFNRIGGVKLIPGSTDFRLIDRSVQQEFTRMTERNRITRGLIDWLGYQREYIYFKASPRLSGDASYSFKKLFKLAIDSTISLSVSPLYIAAYIGAVILPISILLGLFMLVDLALGDPAHLHATGSAYLMVLVLFLVGILLVSQAIIGLYLSHIHAETQNRPLYVIDEQGSANLHEG